MALKDLFRPKWKNSNKIIRLDAIAKITNQSLVIKIARDDESVRFSALLRLQELT